MARPTVALAAWTRARPGLELALVALLFLGGFTLFFADALFGRVLGYGDGPGYFEPFFEHPWSLWTDGLFCGYPIAGDTQSGVFNPLALVLRAVGGSFDAFVVSGYALCGAGGWALGRTLTGSSLAGLASGAALPLSGFVMGQLDHVAAVHVAGWVALALAALEAFHRSGSARAWAGLALSVGGAVLAGSLQFTVWGGVLLVAVAVARAAPRRDRWRFLGAVALAAVLAALLAMVALSPAVELVGLSMRSRLEWENFVSNSYAPGLLPSFFFPGLFLGGAAPAGVPGVESSGYVGVVVLLLAVAGLATAPRADRLLWGSVVAVALTLSLGPSTPLARLVFHIPGLNLFRGPSRHFFELSLGVAALCAHGVAAALRRETSGRRLAVVGVAFALLLAAACGLLLWQTPAVLAVPLPAERLSPVSSAVAWPFVTGAAALALLASSRRRPVVASAALVALVAAELVWLHRHASSREAMPLEGTAPVRAEVAPLLAGATAGGHRSLVLRGYWDALVPANGALRLGASSASGYSPLEPRAYAELTGIDPNGVVFDPGPLVGEGNQLLDVLAVGVVVTGPSQHLAAPRFEPLLELPEGRVYRNARVRPRAWFVREVLAVERDEAVEALTKGALPGGRRFDAASMALVERAEARQYEGPGCEATMVARGEGWLEVDTSCGAAGFLVVSERGFPGWRATVDGAAAPLFRTDLLVSGLQVPAGRHAVRLVYRPSSVWGGGLATLAGLAVLAFVSARRPRWFPAGDGAGGGGGVRGG